VIMRTKKMQEPGARAAPESAALPLTAYCTPLLDRAYDLSCAGGRPLPAFWFRG
jgi:hypothetical protein